jgi:hypothetical protein
MSFAVTSAVTAGTAVATAIAGTRDARQRTFFLQQMEILDFDQKKKLNDELIKANSEDARQAILASTLGSVSSKRVETLGALALEKEKTKKVVTIISLGAGILLFGGVLLVLMDNKKD